MTDQQQERIIELERALCFVGAFMGERYGDRYDGEDEDADRVFAALEKVDPISDGGMSWQELKEWIDLDGYYFKRSKD